MPEDTEVHSALTPDVMDPVEVERIIADLQGFGISDTEQLITMKVGNRTVNLRLANLSVDDEIQALLANHEIRDKGHVWIHQMRCDLLSRAVTWINGVRVTEDLVLHDSYAGKDRPVRPILRDTFLRWGYQAVLILFKVYMLHCQRMEDGLLEQLPDGQIMTEVERRFMEQVAEELKATGVSALASAMDETDETADIADEPID